MTDKSEPPRGSQEETVKQKSERLKAARLQAEQNKEARIEWANRKAAARRKCWATANPDRRRGGSDVRSQGAFRDFRVAQNP